MSIVYVTNTSTHQKGTLRSHDGDSIEILASAQNIPIDSKFLWRMPKHITQNQAPVLSLTQPVEEQSNLEQAMERAKLRRMGKGPGHHTAVINRYTTQKESPNPSVSADESKKTNVLGSPEDHVTSVGRNPKLSTGGPSVR